MYKSQADIVKDWLCAYRAEEQKINGLIEEIRELRSRIMSIGAQEITDMPRAPFVAGDELAEYVIKLEALESRLDRDAKVHEKDRSIIMDLAVKLKRRDEREIIKQRYIFACEWSEVLSRVYRYGKDFAVKQEAYRRKMYRAHESALEELGRMWSIK